METMSFILSNFPNQMYFFFPSFGCPVFLFLKWHYSSYSALIFFCIEPFFLIWGFLYVSICCVLQKWIKKLLNLVVALFSYWFITKIKELTMKRSMYWLRIVFLTLWEMQEKRLLYHQTVYQLDNQDKEEGLNKIWLWMSAKYNEGLFVEHRKICAKAIWEEIIECGLNSSEKASRRWS